MIRDEICLITSQGNAQIVNFCILSSNLPVQAVHHDDRVLVRSPHALVGHVDLIAFTSKLGAHLKLQNEKIFALHIPCVAFNFGFKNWTNVRQKQFWRYSFLLPVLKRL
jgi:hypothetical protein